MVMEESMTTCQDDLLWITLVREGKFDLIEKLRKAELREEGFTTIVVTKEGFSENDWVHNMVIRWLKRHKIHVIDVMYEIGNLEVAASSFCQRVNE